MSVFILPLKPDLPHYTFACELEGVSYGFEFRWNSRDAAWFMTILTGDDVVIAAGIKVVLDFPLGVRRASALMPPGSFIAVDTTGQGEAPGLNDLGERVQLSYLDSSE